MLVCGDAPSSAAKLCVTVTASRFTGHCKWTHETRDDLALKFRIELLFLANIGDGIVLEKD